MKFEVENKPKFTSIMKEGTVLRLTDSLDSCSGIYIVDEMNEEQLILTNIRRHVNVTINSSDDLSRYEFEVGRMEFVLDEQEENDNDTYTKGVKHPFNKIGKYHEAPTKQECEKALDEYAKHIVDMITKKSNGIDYSNYYRC